MRYPKYRAYWFGFLGSVFGQQIFVFVQFLLVHELTGSVRDLGVLGVAIAIPAILLGVFGGVFADRLDKRKLIIATQSIAGVSMLVLAILTQTGVVAVWHVLIVAFVTSGVGAFDSPARSAYYPRLIDRSAMLSAVALNTTVWQSTRVVSPALAGIIVTTIGRTQIEGIAVALFISSGAVFSMVAVMTWIRVSGLVESTRNPLQSLVEGLRYIRGESIVFFLILMAFVYSLFGWAFIVLMPTIAADVLEIGPDRQGALFAAAGVGALVVTIALALSGGSIVQRSGLLVIGGAGAFGALIAAFALTSEYIGSYPLALVLMFLLGFSQTIYSTASMGSLQLIIPDDMRGRVFGVYGIIWGIQPLSGALAAFFARYIGVPWAVAIGGGVVVVFALGPALMNPRLRSLRVGVDGPASPSSPRRPVASDEASA
jgi:MFS family permease